MITFNFPTNYAYIERFFECFIQGSLFTTAAVFAMLTLLKASRTVTTPHLRWLIPLTVFVAIEAVTDAIATIYALLNAWEPEPFNTIVDVIDTIAYGALLWFLVVLWKMVRHVPDLLRTPWLNANETSEGVWPPAPKVR